VVGAPEWNESWGVHVLFIGGHLSSLGLLQPAAEKKVVCGCTDFSGSQPGCIRRGLQQGCTNFFLDNMQPGCTDFLLSSQSGRTIFMISPDFFKKRKMRRKEWCDNEKKKGNEKKKESG
jgi:hypothetical protein